MAEYASTTEDGACIFCKISSGDIKTPGVFWENDEFMAFLSMWPNTKGTTVLMPKMHYESDVLRLPDETLGRFVLAAKTVSRILENHFNDVGRVGLAMEGTGIDHAHIKLFPLHGTEHMKKGKWKQQHSGIDSFFETYEGYFATNDGPKANEAEIKTLAKTLRKMS